MNTFFLIMSIATAILGLMLMFLGIKYDIEKPKKYLFIIVGLAVFIFYFLKAIEYLI